MLPELLVHHLTGVVTAEPSSAGTTGLLDLATGTWSAELADAVGVDPSRCSPALQPAGTQVGSWRGIPVHLVGGHDTASAVLAGRRARRAVRRHRHVAARRARAGRARHVGRGLRRRARQRARRARRRPPAAQRRRVVVGRGVPSPVGRRRPRRPPRATPRRSRPGARRRCARPSASSPRRHGHELADLAGLPDPTDRAAITRCAGGVDGGLDRRR